MNDIDALVTTLALVMSKNDAETSAIVLLERFGSLANCLSATPFELKGLPSIGRSHADVLKRLRDATVALMWIEVSSRPFVENWDPLIDYLYAVLAREKLEIFRVLYLDRKNRLILDEVLSRGTVNFVAIPIRTLFHRSLELEAARLILVHNHPSGDPTPSQQDISMTTLIRRTAASLSIILVDHIIIGNGTYVSLRRIGLL